MSGLLLALGTAIAGVIAWEASVRMRPSAKALGKPGIVDLQFAGTAAAVDQLKGIWGSSRILAARENTQWDASLIFGYTSGLALLGLLLHQPAAATFGWSPQTLGVVVVAVPVIAGLCDVVENILTFRMLDRNPTGADAIATKVLAIAKWLGLLLALVWNLLIALPIAIVRWFV